VLCVGAVDRNRQRSMFSNFGRGLGIVAPGGSGPYGGSEEDDIYSTFGAGGYAYEAGTSQATPHVSGVAALLASLGVRGRGAADRLRREAPAHRPDAHPPRPGHVARSDPAAGGSPQPRPDRRGRPRPAPRRPRPGAPGLAAALAAAAQEAAQGAAVTQGRAVV